MSSTKSQNSTHITRLVVSSMINTNTNLCYDIHSFLTSWSHQAKLEFIDNMLKTIVLIASFLPTITAFQGISATSFRCPTTALAMSDNDFKRWDRASRSAQDGDNLVELVRPLGLILQEDDQRNVFVETLAPKGNAARSGKVREWLFVNAPEVPLYRFLLTHNRLTGQRGRYRYHVQFDLWKRNVEYSRCWFEPCTGCHSPSVRIDSEPCFRDSGPIQNETSSDE